MSTQISTTLDYFRARWVEQSTEALRNVLSNDISIVDEDGRLGTREAVSQFLLTNETINSFCGYDSCDITEFHVIQQDDGRLQITYNVQAKKNGKVAHTSVKREELLFDSQNLIQKIIF